MDQLSLESKEQKNARRELAKVASQSCRYCRGVGVVVVYAPEFDGSSLRRDCNGELYAASVMAHCQCEYGQFINEHTPGELQDRIPRVADILAGSSRWLLNPPGEQNSYPDGHVDEADFNALWHKIKSGQMLKHADHEAPPKQTAWDIETKLRQRLVMKLGLDRDIADESTLEDLLEIERFLDRRAGVQSLDKVREVEMLREVLTAGKRDQPRAALETKEQEHEREPV